MPGAQRESLALEKRMREQRGESQPLPARILSRSPLDQPQRTRPFYMPQKLVGNGAALTTLSSSQR